MPLHIIREDITRMEVDAIVAAGSARPGTPLPTGGVNGSIHRKAGMRLLQALRRLGGIRTAAVTLTKGYDLPCKYVIHTAGPKWKGGSYGEEKLLRSCYEEALKLAKRKGFASIAFPLISSGKYGYPKAEALQVAVSTIRSFLKRHDMEVFLVVYDREAFVLSDELYSGVAQYISQHYVDEHYVPRQSRESNWASQTLPPMLDAADFYGEDEDFFEEIANCLGDEFAVQTSDQGLDDFLQVAPSRESGFEDDWSLPEMTAPAEDSADADDDWEIGFDDYLCESSADGGGVFTAPAKAAPMAPARPMEAMAAPKYAAPLSLEEQLKQLDAGFAETLLHLIDQSGMTDAECYTLANVDRKLFNKIKNNPGYKPKKPTVVAFCAALRLNLEESRELLARAGYAMSRSNMFDVIVEFCFVNGMYDVDVINQVLFQYDQPQLGSKTI